MINYTGTIFQQSGSELDSNTCSIIVAAIQVAGVYTSSMLVDRVGRKALLLISTSGAAIALAMLGTFSYLHRLGADVQAFDFVPLLSFSFYVFITCIGIMPLPFVILAEILPPKVSYLDIFYFFIFNWEIFSCTQIREIGSTICMVSISVFAFISLQTFPMLIDNYGLHVAMGVCCAVCLLGILFVVFILKETKGKNLNTLEEK